MIVSVGIATTVTAVMAASKDDQPERATHHGILTRPFPAISSLGQRRRHIGCAILLRKNHVAIARRRAVAPS